MTPDEAARACAAAMWENDSASRGLGVRIEAVRAGHARLAMEVGPAMVNGHGMCHGGFIFTLADSAFAFACNTYDVRTVAAHCAITYLRPARLGDTLVATAEERVREGRSGIYDIRVTVGAETVAEFRGQSRTIGGAIIGDVP